MRTTLAVCALALAAASPAERSPLPPPLRFKEERITLAYTASAGEAAIVLQAETETPLSAIEIRDAHGREAFRMDAATGRGLAMSGFVLESFEAAPGELARVFPNGRYTIHGVTVDGRAVYGKAELEHGIPNAPVVLYPLPGDVAVPADDIVIHWMPDTSIQGYRVFVEQNENDGLVVQLPAGTTEFRVPPGVLLGRTATQVEVAAIGSNGNRTLVEVEFQTR